jgi:hydroxyacylglutathione hydrolase
MQLVAIPAFTDNYIWVASVGPAVLAVDPGDAEPLLNWLAATHATLAAILITHHHRDHIGGLSALRKTFSGPVFGPPTIAHVTHGVTDGATVTAAAIEFTVMAVPGHTLDHLAYYAAAPAPGEAPLLFCGDTLFACGCGRLFEGTPLQMLTALDRLACLPAATRVCCTHEYTLANQRFALAVEPDNAALKARHQRDLATRAVGQPTLPSALADELATNPFMRCSEPTVQRAASRQHGQELAHDRLATFTALRTWKNQF